MIDVTFYTNLDDVMKFEKFPERLAFRPMVDDMVESLYKRKDGMALTLRVCSVTITGENSMEVELHLPKRFQHEGGMRSWENWAKYVRSLPMVEKRKMR